MLEIIILVVTFVGGVSSHSYGADLQACDTMKPGHGGVLRQRTRSPYTIQTNNRFYVPCQTQPIMGRQMTCGVIGKSLLFLSSYEMSFFRMKSLYSRSKIFNLLPPT